MSGRIKQAAKTADSGGMRACAAVERSTMKIILIPLLSLVSACSDPAALPLVENDSVTTGHLAHIDIDEASGLARSNIAPGRFWAINDSGSGPLLFAMGNDGSHHAVVALEGAVNRDWEDLASYVFDGQPMLLIADIGDNMARRTALTLYIVAEPTLEQQDTYSVRIARQIDVILPDGAHDSEAVSVDTIGEMILILSKRDIPAVLYEVPLRAEESDGPVLAKRLGIVDSIPQPTAADRRRAPVADDWYWQPTAMDISPDGGTAVILTYRGLYFYPRGRTQSWIEALRRPPVTTMRVEAGEAEAVAFSADGADVYVTVEQRHAPLLRFNMRNQNQ